MRLDKLTVGSEKDSLTHQFKNLKNVTVDFDQGHWVTVLIGWNGTGKSNVLEALAIIFRDLIGGKKAPAFAYRLAYRMGSGDKTRRIHIDADPDRLREPYSIHLFISGNSHHSSMSQQELELNDVGSYLPPGDRIKFSAFLADSDLNLPRYVFSYYSGESSRMHEVFRPYLENYDNRLRKGEDPGLKRLFFAMPVHSQFVLLAFLIRPSEIVREFLDQHLGLDPDDGIESVLFVLRQPPWSKKGKNKPGGDPRFWNARGVVRDFLARLHEIALAPVRIKRKVPVSLWNRKTLEFLYLYIKDMSALRRLVGDQPPSEFFRDLESTYVSELIEEVRIRVKLRKNDERVTFRELSEGEQQLLTVLGLLRFTAGEESLLLLDEPDTHLNPRWSVEYLSYLEKLVGADAGSRDSSHIVFTTHNPLAIAELIREQVQILHRQEGSGAIEANHPEEHPRGMGYAGIITSDMFGLGSSLDKKTNADLLSLHALSIKLKLTDGEKRELARIRSRLEGLDFNFASRDRLETEFLRARFDLAERTEFDDPILTAENKKNALKALVSSLLNPVAEENS